MNTFFSNLKRSAKPMMKIMAVDFDMVYNETVMNSKLQFERPMSRAEAIPTGAICDTYGLQVRTGLLTLVQLSHVIRTQATRMNFTRRWPITIESG